MVCCKFCKASSPSYVCPRCMAPYCSLSCYKCEGHSSCSEGFYRQCVEDEMRQQSPNDLSKKQMQAILARGRQAQESDDDVAFEDRFASVNLDDPDEVLQAMTNEQRITFERLVESNGIGEYVSEWKPWWLQAKTLIQDVVKPVEEQTDSLEEFRRQRKEVRAKIGGRKVKHLNVKVANTSSTNGNNTSHVQGNPRGDRTSKSKKTPFGGDQCCKSLVTPTNDTTKGAPIDQKVPPTNVEPALPDAHHARHNKKTRIIDKRYHGKEGTSTVEFLSKAKTGGDDTQMEAQIPAKNRTEESQPNRTALDKVVAVSHDECARPHGGTIEKKHGDISKISGGGREEQSPCGLLTAPPANQNLLLDSLIGISSSEPKQLPPEWGDRETTLAANLINMLAAFVFVKRFFNGDSSDVEIDAADTLQSVCAVFKGQNFQTVDIAICDVLQRDLVITNPLADMLISDVSLILHSAEYVQRALFETRTILKMARRCLDARIRSKSTESREADSGQEPGESHVNTNDDQTHRRGLKLLMLKVDFYFDWATKNMAHLQKFTLPLIALEKEKSQLTRMVQTK